MESQFFAFLATLLSGGVLSEGALILILIFMVSALSYYFIRPMFKKVEKIPDVTELKKLLKDTSDGDHQDIHVLSKKLDKIMSILEELDDIGRADYREVKDLKRDVETIKQILNQFQGHMMYGGRASDFGNRELK